MWEQGTGGDAPGAAAHGSAHKARTCSRVSGSARHALSAAAAAAGAGAPGAPRCAASAAAASTAISAPAPHAVRPLLFPLLNWHTKNF